MNIVEFWTICSSNGIILDEKQREQIIRYEKELRYWNEKVNLISRRDTDNILEKHILHSLAILAHFEFKNKANCIDVGTGGGLPGIPLKIANPSLKFTLVDSIAKKIKMTSMFAQHTGLHGINVINARAEELAEEPMYKHKFDYFIARAVSPLQYLVEWAKPLLKSDATMVLLKGGDLEEEYNDALDRFPSLKIETKPLKLFGYDGFEKDDKKILLCKLY